MKIFKAFWSRFQRISFFIGNVITGFFLFIFYYSVFMIFAVPFRLFSDPLGLKNKDSNWHIKKSNPKSLAYFRNE